MKLETYLEQIHLIPMDQARVGKLMGNATLDKDINPEQYGILCEMSKLKGFKFINIQLS